MTYELQDGLNTKFGFPYFYTITNIRHKWFQGAESAHDIYSSSIACNALMHSSEEDITCRRLPLTDDTCATDADGCVVYSVPQNASVCSFACTRMVFIADFTLDIEYSNFDGIDLPLKGGICSANGVYGEVEHIGTNATKASKSSDINVSTRPGFPWLGAVGIVLAVTAAFIACIIVKRKSKNINMRLLRAKLSRRSSSKTNSDHAPGDDGSPGMELHRLDTPDVQETIFGDCDEHGYTIIHDANTRNSRQDRRDMTRRCRPLPQRPVSTDDASTIIVSETTASLDQVDSPRSASLSFTGVSSSSLLSSPDSELRNEPRPILVPSRKELTSDYRLSNIRPRPRPHRRLVDLEDHEYLGLVNLRSHHTMFGQVSEVKLVRSALGHLELVSVDDESSAFTDYYTRIRGDDQLGVAGVVKELPSSESNQLHPDTPRQRCVTHTCCPQQPASTEDSCDALVGYPGGEADTMFLEIIYLGSLECEEDIDFSECEYLNVLDTDVKCKVCGGDVYLTPLDVDNINMLTCLNFNS